MRVPDANQDPGAGWRVFGLVFAAATAATLVALYGFALALDPYGRHTSPTRPPTPIMDVNQRYMYPQLARSGLYDSAIFGTSTVRLLDPARLGAAFGARFVNLAINAGTPWEQIELARFFLRHVPAPRVIVMGLDLPWCDPQADSDTNRLTARSFPPWLYDDNPLNDLPELLNLRTLEIASRVVLHALGWMPERIRRDGYEVFTPPEESYDLARARTHIRAGRLPAPSAAERWSGAAIPRRGLPALAWLARFVDELPQATRLVILFPPVHVAAQPAPGSRDAARDQACKARIAQIVSRRHASVIDYRFPSPLTSQDENYWDPMHYRLAIARRLVDEIRAAVETGRPSQDGWSRVLPSGG